MTPGGSNGRSDPVGRCVRASAATARAPDLEVPFARLRGSAAGR